MGQLNIDLTTGPSLTDLVLALRERSKTLQEMAQQSVYFYRDPTAYDEKAAAKHLLPENHDPLIALQANLAALPVWQASTIHEVLLTTATTHGLKIGKLAQPLRVALSGSDVSPPIDLTAQLIGRERCLARLQHAIHFIAAGGHAKSTA